MRNNLTKLSAAVLLAVTLFSCGSSRFTRSHYGNRSWTKVETADVEKATGTELEKTEGEDAIVLAESKKAAQVKNTASSAIVHESTSVVPEMLTTENNENSSSTSSGEKIQDALQSEATTNEVADRTSEKQIIPVSSDATTGGDTELILLVILAIIIPPLGVYLKDGSVSTMFWITLILCLLGGGWLWGWGFFFGGFWGIAAILALLYVLDVI